MSDGYTNMSWAQVRDENKNKLGSSDGLENKYQLGPSEGWEHVYELGSSEGWL